MIATFLTSLRKKISLSVLIYFLLIFIILSSVLQAIELVIRGTSVEVLRPLVTYGMILGWLLGRSELKKGVVFLLSSIIGTTFTLLHVGGVGSAVWNFIQAGIRFLWSSIFKTAGIDVNELNFLGAVIQSRMMDVAANFSNWISNLFSGYTIYNQVSTLILWGLLMWCLAVWFSWITRKHYQPLWGLIPAAILLAILLTYTLEKRILLVFVLGAGLILIGLINQEEKILEWRRRGIIIADRLKEKITVTVVGLSIGIMLIAGIMPSISINAISDPIERWLYGDPEPGEFDGEFSGGEASFNNSIYTVERFAGLPRQKLIGTGPELAKRVVMIVKFPNNSFVRSEIPNAGRYWRAYSYDQYTGTGWQSSPTSEVSYKPGQEIADFQSEYFNIITQEIRLSNALRGTLYSAGLPVTLDQEVLVSWRLHPGGDSNEEQSVEFVNDLFAVTQDSIQYQVRSLIPTVNDENLRLSVPEYPEWIRSRYLALPESVPDRVLGLAEEIVANQPTSYDQAKAIETFLRSYPYTLALPAPPSDRDVADYFLFDLQTGYCDYYATSMVVLARAVGLPARVVVGYVGGQLDEENNHYLVSEADAHTWVEIYFSGFGWIPFEPTAALNLIDDQELSLPLPPELEQLPQTAELIEKRAIPVLEIGLGMFVLIIVGAWFGNWTDIKRLQQMNMSALALTLYLRLYRYGRWLGIGHQRSDTLYEFDNKIKGKIRNIADSPWKEKQLIGAVTEIGQLTEYAVYANFCEDSLDQKLVANTIVLWKKLRVRLRYTIWISFWKGFVEKVFRVNQDENVNANQ